MIVVAGSLYVDEGDRDTYLEDCREVIVAASGHDIASSSPL